MNKELYNRMLAKQERNRIKRAKKKKFLRANPNWEENTHRSISTAAQRKEVDRSRFQNVFQKKSEQRSSMLSKIASKFTSMFRRRSA